MKMCLTKDNEARKKASNLFLSIFNNLPVKLRLFTTSTVYFILLSTLVSPVYFQSFMKYNVLNELETIVDKLCFRTHNRLYKRKTNHIYPL